MRNAVLIAAAATTALALASAALAHVTVSPAFLAAGESTTLTFDAPNERAGDAMTELAVGLPQGLEAVAADQPETEGWQLSISGNQALWTGGTVPTGETQMFELRVSASGEPGAVKITAEQRYDSGATVAWSPSFTILPPPRESPRQHLGRALIAAIVGLVIVGASVVLVQRLRRRTLQDE